MHIHMYLIHMNTQTVSGQLELFIQSYRLQKHPSHLSIHTAPRTIIQQKREVYLYSRLTIREQQRTEIYLYSRPIIREQQRREVYLYSRLTIREQQRREVYLYSRLTIREQQRRKVYLYSRLTIREQQRRSLLVQQTDYQRATKKFTCIAD